ncbi:MAG: CDP-alcohol phosphatidyltransferase family protein [Candidatus Puniceispirillaceae bacterium]
MAKQSEGGSGKNPARRKPFRSVSMNWLLPNMLTIGGLVSGLTGLRFALDGIWMTAVALIVLAAIFDTLDGRMARLLKSTSAFGAALDSLSDAVVFGVVPALCLYLWALQGSGNFAWGTALFFAVCILLRLARFDSELPDRPEYTRSFFVGVPAPAAAFLVLAPIVAEQVFAMAWLKDETTVSLVLVAVGAAAVSILPTFNGKNFKVPSQAILPFLAVIALVGAMIAMQPWVVYLGLAALYLGSLPISCLAYLRHRRNFLKRQAGTD